MQPWLAALFLLAACAAPARSAPDVPSTPYLVALGTAQDGGLPQLGCRRPCCEAARADPGRRRLVTSLLLVDPRTGRRWLFDATPDLAEQVERARPHGAATEAQPGRPALFDGIFLTHAHLGHYVGLLELGREAYGSAQTTIIATPRMLAFLEGNGPWSLLFDADHAVGMSLAPGERIQLADDLAVTAWAVPHRDEFSDTVAFRIDGPERSALYLPDIDKWERWKHPLEDVLAGVDWALVDGTFFGPAELPGRDMAAVPHPFIVETLARVQGLPLRERRKLLFTHLNHSNPAADPDSSAARTVRDAGCAVLAEGAVLRL